MPESVRYILALDSAVNACGVCIYDAEEERPLAKTIEPMSRGQAEALIPLVQDAVQQSGIDFSDIDLIATTIGPGTFSGLRVGLSASKSYALSLDKPVLGFSTLVILAAGFAGKNKDADDIAVLIESKRQDFYFQHFDNQGNPKSPPNALMSDAIVDVLGANSCLIIGDGCERFLHECQGKAQNIQYIEGVEHPDPEILAVMAFSEFQNGKKDHDVEPLYLRGADISHPKNKPRTLKAL